MKRKKAISIQLDALRKMKQGIVFDANVQRVYQVNTPYAVNCLKRVEEIDQVIAMLKAGDDPVQQYVLEELLTPVTGE